MTKSRGILPPRHFWTDSEVELLFRLYPDTPTADIATKLGMSVQQVYSKAAQLDLKKSDAYLAGPAACRLRRGDNVGAQYRFKKGQVSHNKGRKGLIYEGGIATQFKKGHRGGKALELYQPIGTERISKDGYIQRKVNDDMPLQRRWRGVHLIVWEEAHGPLPKGHALVFKDGNRQNCAIENLELVTRGELMRRNSYHTNYPKEIAQLIQLRCALNRKINHATGKTS